MRDGKNILEVASLSPDYMGFIFYSGSPRYVQKDFSIPDGFPSTIVKVGVFVNERTEVIKTIASRLRLPFIQLHGNEPVEQCEELKGEGYGVIKVFSVDDAFDFKITNLYASCVDLFLFDTKGKYYGGNSKAFDWKILHRYDQQVPFFLSGGLSPENIDQLVALNNMNLYAIDINSGVEISPGVKNIDKIKQVTKIINSVL